MLESLNEIERAIRASWSAETCDPVDLPWSPEHPARGQCGVTRPADTSNGRLAGQYRALADAVSARLP